MHVKYYCTWLVHKSNGKRSFAIVGHMKSAFCKNKHNFFNNYFSRNYMYKCIMFEPVNLQPYILKLAAAKIWRIHCMSSKNSYCHPVTVEWFSLQILINFDFFKLSSFACALQGSKFYFLFWTRKNLIPVMLKRYNVGFMIHVVWKLKMCRELYRKPLNHARVLSQIPFVVFFSHLTDRKMHSC